MCWPTHGHYHFKSPCACFDICLSGQQKKVDNNFENVQQVRKT